MNIGGGSLPTHPISFPGAKKVYSYFNIIDKIAGAPFINPNHFMENLSLVVVSFSITPFKFTDQWKVN